jgi:ABC-type Mn2+/Zn2+ transport system permease subunit/Mn-dependent DtxR family transcriptional regulator
MELLQILTEEWAIRGLIASALVGIMCGMIGCFIVLRNMSLIGDAQAHAILPGVVVAFLVVGYSTIGFFIGSVIAGLITAFLITWIQHRSDTKNDAAVGIIFTAMFALGVIGISYLNNQQGVHLDLSDFLFGTTLGVSNEDLYICAGITIYVLISIIIFYRYFFLTTFQPTIARSMGISVSTMHYFLMLMLVFVIVASLSTVGLILVVAMLVTPPSTALLLSSKLKNVIAIAALLGFITTVTGFILAIVLETPPGPLMAVVATLFYLLTLCFAPEKGLVAKYFIKRSQLAKIQQEDILKQALRIPKGESLPELALVERLGYTWNRLNSHLKKLTAEGLILTNKDGIQLSLKGKEKAEKLVRAHRLWESYQVNKMGLTEGQIHDEAERMEHLLTDEMVDEVDGVLGYPTADPHGSPIPPKKQKPLNPLLKLRPRQKASISKNQINDWVESELWELGLLPDKIFMVEKIGTDHVTIFNNQESVKIPAKLASLINVN